MAEIFISYSSRDRDAAHSLAQQLRTHGFESLFLDSDIESGIAAGRNWEDELYEKLRRARVVLILYSESWRESRWCFAEFTHARVLRRTVIPICLDDTPLDTLLGTLQAVKYSAPDTMLRILEGLRLAGITADLHFIPDPSRVPFPGLPSFQPDDSAVFFGREDEVRRILDRIALLRLVGDRRFILLAGPSGSGKSSLLLAGLVPRLRAESGDWSVCAPIRGGAYRPGTLKAAILSANVPAEGRTVVISIDQLEEIFTSSPLPDGATSLLNELSGILGNPEQRVVAFGTMRTDAVAELERVLESTDVKLELLRIDPISRAGLMAAITEPCDLYGIAIDIGLAEKMADDCGDWKALPALAYTLREMFERTRPPRRFTKDLYNALGTVTGVLNERMRVLVEESGIALKDVRGALFEMVRVEWTPDKCPLGAEMDTSQQVAIIPRNKEGSVVPQRQRRSIAEKRRIVEETLLPGASVARVARAHGINANQVFGWRRLYLEHSHP